MTSETMTVTIRDRAREAPWGSSGPIRPYIRTVTISAHCPQCGARRGEPRGLNQCEDGAYYWVQVWDNPCGHVDRYEDVVREADTLAAEGGESRVITQLVKVTTQYHYAISNAPAVRTLDTLRVAIKPEEVVVYIENGLVGIVAVRGRALRRDGTLGAYDSTGYAAWDHRDGTVPDWIEDLLRSVDLKWGSEFR